MSKRNNYITDTEYEIALNKFYNGLDNFTDHIENMSHLSETSRLELPDDTFYLDTSRPHHEIKHELYLFIEKNKYR